MGAFALACRVNATGNVLIRQLVASARDGFRIQIPSEDQLIDNIYLLKD